MEIFRNGAKFVRFDCHLHTVADKEFKYDNSNCDFIKKYVSKLKEENISVGVITNHNKFDKAEFVNLKKQAIKDEILLLPGTELSVKEGQNGIHVLIVFSENWISDGKDNINTFLDSAFIGIKNRENENTRCKEDLAGVIALLDSFNMDYFMIFAHVDNKSGLFHECNGGLIKSLFENEKISNKVLGLQKSSKIDNYSNFTNWTNRNLAKIEGSDPKAIEDIGKGNKKTYLKIGNFNYKTIKYALMDKENRVCTSIDSIKHGYIESINFYGGIMDSKEIYFSPELNNIIGIRGSGKSAILEIIRDIFNIECSEVDKEYKEKIVSYYMGAGGVVELKLVDKYGKKYIITKHFSDNTTYITNDKGEPKDIKVEMLLNNILYFGQKDLSIRIDGYEEDLINKLIGKSNINDTKLNTLVNEIINCINEFKKLEELPEKLEDEKKELNTIKEKLKIFEEKGVSKKLEKEESFNEDANIINNLINNITQLFVNEETESDFSEFKNYNSKYNKKIFDNINIIIKEIESLIKKRNVVINEIKKKEQDLLTLFNEYNTSKKEFITEFEEIKRELNLQNNLDGDTYLKLKEQNNKIENKINEINKQLNKKDAVKNKLIRLLKERRNIIQKNNEKYLKYITEINSKENNIKIEFEENGNRSKFGANLKEKIKGSGVRGNCCYEIANHFVDYLGILEDILINDSFKIKKLCSSNEVKKIEEKLLNDIEQVTLYLPNNKITIKYHDKNIENYSLGQRASAVLLFVLAQNDNDLIIIDQPEDDMDNQVIYKELIKTIKETKKSIQFIFTTHNPNIPVLGDAEEIISLKESNGLIINNNSIDNEQIQKDIVEIMEGGQEAFDKREKIYGEWNTYK